MTLISLLDFKTKFFLYRPKITSEPIAFAISKISFFLFNNFFLIKKFRMLAAFIDPPPNPASEGIFFFIVI